MAKPIIQGRSLEKTIDPKKFVALAGNGYLFTELTSDRTVLKNGAKRYFLAAKVPYQETIGDAVIDRSVSVHSVVTLVPGTTGNVVMADAAAIQSALLYNMTALVSRLETGLPVIQDDDEFTVAVAE